jgi:hypothetical protein
MVNRTRPIGDVFYYTNPSGSQIALRVVESDSCNGCFFHGRNCNRIAEYRGHCSKTMRDDNKNVSFEKVGVKAHFYDIK